MSDQTKKPVYINRENFTDKIKSYLRHPGSMILMFLVMLATFITFALLLFLIFYILINGIPYIKPSLFSLHYTSDNASVIPALINTVVMTLLSLLIAVPFGIFSAIFLVEYAGKGNKFIEVIRLTTETLSGIPSIVYGLFGMLFFVNTLKWGFSVLAGAFTLSIMILPLIMRQTEEALKAVPDSYREGSFGLGAGKLRTVFRIVLPIGSSWNPCGCDPCHWTYRRRDGSTDLYSRNGCTGAKECTWFRSDTGNHMYMLSRRRAVYEPGVCDSCYFACTGCCDQHPFRCGCEETDESIERKRKCQR